MKETPGSERQREGGVITQDRDMVSLRCPEMSGRAGQWGHNSQDPRAARAEPTIGLLNPPFPVHFPPQSLLFWDVQLRVSSLDSCRGRGERKEHLPLRTSSGVRSPTAEDSGSRPRLCNAGQGVPLSEP